MTDQPLADTTPDIPILESGIVTYDPKQALAATKGSVALVDRLIKDNVLINGVDYGKIPGVEKPCLFKSGAEKLLTAFQFYPLFYPTANTVMDWDKGFFNFEYECRIYRRSDNRIEGSGIGSCNSKEKKYHYRWVRQSEIPVGVDLTVLPTRSGVKSELAFAIEKAATTGQYGKPQSYWDEFKTSIADGSARAIMRKLRNGDEKEAWEIGDTLYRVNNDEIYDQVNTISKISQKRGFVAATLIATGASAVLTQDLEDFTDFDFSVSIEKPTAPPQNHSNPTEEVQGDYVDPANPKSWYENEYNIGVTRNTLKASFEGLTLEDALSFLKRPISDFATGAEFFKAVSELGKTSQPPATKPATTPAQQKTTPPAKPAEPEESATSIIADWLSDNFYLPGDPVPTPVTFDVMLTAIGKPDAMTAEYAFELVGGKVNLMAAQAIIRKAAISQGWGVVCRTALYQNVGKNPFLKLQTALGAYIWQKGRHELAKELGNPDDFDWTPVFAWEAGKDEKVFPFPFIVYLKTEKDRLLINSVELEPPPDF